MQRSEGLDWLKAIGIALIVYGHVGAASTVTWTPPIYVKQLGVAFFIFATGYALASERRPAAEALISRLFPVYLFGLSLAAIISVIGLLSGAGFGSGTGLQLSNYLPFLGGANVVLNHFPANPSTWYVGTYLHLLVVWAVWLRHQRVGIRFIVGVLLLEIAVRAALVMWAGPFVAYMLLTNWMSVLLLGLLFGHRRVESPPTRALPYFAVLVIGLAGSALGWRFTNLELTFPFMTLHGLPPTLGTLVVSTAISTLYVATTLVTYGAVRRLAAPRVVKFLAQNSLFVFLVHMPVYFALHPLLVAWQLSYPTQTLVLFLVCLPFLAACSVVIVKVVRPKQLAKAVQHLVISEKRHGAKVEAIGA